MDDWDWESINVATGEWWIFFGFIAGLLLAGLLGYLIGVRRRIETVHRYSQLDDGL